MILSKPFTCGQRSIVSSDRKGIAVESGCFSSIYRPGTLLIIRIGRGPGVIEEKLFVFRNSNRLENAWGPSEIKEATEIVLRTSVCKSERAFVDAEIVFDKPQDAAKVVAGIIDVALGCVRRHKKKRD